MKSSINMSLPTYDNFIEPLIRYLATHPEGIFSKLACENVANVLGLNDSQKNELLPSGLQPVYKNRTGWAHDRLKRAGLSTSPRKGFWKITDKGLKFVENHQNKLPNELIIKLALGYEKTKSKHVSSDNQEINGELPEVLLKSDHALASPDDRLGLALDELRRSAKSQLLEHLTNVSPTFFETIVLDLLHRMGYGASRSDLLHVGGTGDGGIDGVISLDRLGLEKVYIQAKRWKENVGRPELQAFYGALAGQKSKKGVFITTSEFTAKGIEFANSVEGIVLIDGGRLTSLMIEYELGISAQTVKIPKIDGDFFDQEEA